MVQMDVFKAHRCSAEWDNVIFLIFLNLNSISFLFIYLRPQLSQPFIKGKKGPDLSVPHLDLLAMSRPLGKVGIPQNSDSSARQAFITALPVRPALTLIEVNKNLEISNSKANYSAAPLADEDDFMSLLN